ncbi:MAG: 4Fe-4S dicluster domain-containing protein [Chloroflexota bacterium]|nr:4Fe-4S dicluster domain-containing protein [Chloroflexota bacterium]
MPKAAIVDISKCTACRGCQVACKQWNDRPGVTTTNRGTYENPPHLSADTWTRIEFYEVGKDGGVEWFFRKHQCMHCTDASCVAVCPVGAMHKEGEYTVNNHDWCIGCGYCVEACPFDAVHKSHGGGTAQKCWFCFDRVTNDMVPACVKTCPPGAIQFGERSDMISMGRQRVQELISAGKPNAYLYGETEVGGTGWLYVLPERPSLLGLPDAPRVATSMVIPQWISGVVAAGVIAALPFYWLFRRKKSLEGSQSNVGGER